MHPTFRSKIIVKAYLSAWIPIGLLFGLMLAVAGRLSLPETVTITIPVVVLLAFLCTTPGYMVRSLPITKSTATSTILTHVVAAMIQSAIVTALVRVFVAFALARTFPHIRERFDTAIPVLAGLVFLVYMLSVALHYVVLAVERSQKAEMLSREAQLKALKAQVNPHFLFNSLNSISALTAVDPSRAREMCIRLSDFLRSSLGLGERLSIPFREELALTRAYLDVEKIRFGNKLRIAQQIDPACDACELPPLMVQPLIENAIKHGIATLVDGGEILFQALRVRDSVEVTVENPFDPEAPASGRSGFGLVNVRDRLQARFGPEGLLQVGVENNLYRVVLSFPCSFRAANEAAGSGSTAPHAERAHTKTSSDTAFAPQTNVRAVGDSTSHESRFRAMRREGASPTGSPDRSQERSDW